METVLSALTIQEWIADAKREVEAIESYESILPD